MPQSQTLVSFFWKRFTKQYIPSLIQRKKWREKRKNLKEGDVLLVAEPNQQLGILPLGRIVTTHRGKKWDGPSSHSAYSIRGVQGTNHKTVCLRGSGDLGLETVNRLDSRRGNAPPLPFIFLIDTNSRQ